jgi:predicted nucleic acid-binding protein
VDTNVLVYANVAQAPLHAVALTRLQEVARTGAPLWLSRQVLRKYLAVVTRPQRWSTPQPLAPVRYLQRWFQVADETAVVTARLLTLSRTMPAGGAQIHDANIVATMQAYGIQRLLTENVADFTRFAGGITIMPLVVPDSSHPVPPGPRSPRRPLCVEGVSKNE